MALKHAWYRASAHVIVLLLCTRLASLGSAGNARSGIDPLCHDNPSVNCAFLDHSAQICTAFPDSEETKSYCPKYCKLCVAMVGTYSSTKAGSAGHITSRYASHVTTAGSVHVTGAPAGTTTAPFTGPCVDDPNAKCADLDHTAHICTLYRNDPTTRTSCPKYCGLCTGHVTTGGSVHVTGAPVGTTTAPFNGPCVDDPAAKCADLDHTAHICTLYRNDPTTRTSCPKYCGLCGDGHVTTGGSGHVTGAPAGTTTAPFTGPCVDDPAAKCADLDNTAHICTLYRNDPTTRTSCPKYCGLCGAGHVTTGGSVHVTGAPAGTTTAPFTGPCVDDPAAKCADLDHTAHICTLYRNDPTTRTSCPKYCGLCGAGLVTTGGSSHVTGAPVGTTTDPFTGPCVDDPDAKCADLDHTAHICTLYRDDPTTRTSCPKYCGLCGAGHLTSGGSGHVTGAPVGTTTDPFTGPCVDDPDAKCADLDHTAHICTLYRNDPTTRTSCPKYCGICGAGHLTTGGSGHVTGAPAGTTTAPLTGQCVDDPDAKCADLDHTAHICTLYRNDPTTRTSCPKYCGLCGDGRYTGGVITTHSILSTRGLTTISHTNPSTNHLASQSTTEFPESTKHTTETTTHPKTTTHFKTTGSVHVTTTESQPPTKRQTTTHRARLSTSTEVTGPSTTASHESLVLQAFHKEDFNKDGSVSFAEFERVWQIMDVNRDGRVTEAEYSRGTHFSRLVSTEVFSIIDRDHNLAITLQELPYIFTLFDTDYSGSIERGEYIKEYSKINNHVQNSLH